MTPQFIKNSRTYRDLLRARKFCKKVGIHPVRLVFPAFSAFIAALFEGASLGLLVPTIQGIIQGNLIFVKEIPILGRIVAWLPERFENRASAILVLLIGLIFMTAVAKCVFQYASTTAVAFEVKRLAHRLRCLIYERYLSFGKLFFDQNNSGELHQVLTGYTAQIAQQLDIVNSFFYSMFTLLVYLVIMISVSWQLTAFVVVVSPLLFFSVQWLIEKIKKTSEAYATSYSKLARNISNYLTCIPLVKAYTHEESERKSFVRESDSVKHLEFSIEKKQLLIAPLQEIVVLSLVLILVGLMAFLLIREKTGEISGFMMFLILLRRSSARLGFFNSLQAALASVRGPFLAVNRILDNRDKHFVSEGKRRFAGLRHEIQFDHLTFNYPKGVQALRGVSFSVERGKMTALVGPSGSGKTTLINLLMRFYDGLQGAIRIDGTNIQEFTLESLRSKMALVGQETLLFNASLRMNLTYGLNGRANSRDIEDAVKKARIHEFVQKLPAGLETEIGDRGVKLSGGEKQRLAIARAILKGAEILILDEATSALDSKTEKLIQQAIDEAIHGRTAIVIAHRLSTITHADKIVVFEDGRLVEEGTLDALLAQKGKFYQSWEAQKFY